MQRMLVRGAVCGAILGMAAMAVAQPPVRKGPQTGGNSFETPVDASYMRQNDVEARRVDMYIGDWHNSLPRTLYGSLVLRDVLSHGDAMNPPQPAAVLEQANFLAWGRLATDAVTVPSTLHGNQEVLYIMDGLGSISAGNQVADLHRGIGVLIPEGLQFQIKSTGPVDLQMYIVDEPTWEGFHPRPDLKIRDEMAQKLSTPARPSPYTSPGASGHWAHIVRTVMRKEDGLATVGGVITVQMNPMTLGEPHPHEYGHQEVWAETDGPSILFIGNQLRVQKVGQAFMIRPDDIMFHSNINTGDGATVKFLWFSGGNPTHVNYYKPDTAAGGGQ